MVIYRLLRGVSVVCYFIMYIKYHHHHNYYYYYLWPEKCLSVYITQIPDRELNTENGKCLFAQTIRISCQLLIDNKFINLFMVPSADHMNALVYMKNVYPLIKLTKMVLYFE